MEIHDAEPSVAAAKCRIRRRSTQYCHIGKGAGAVAAAV